jgi:nucleotide-binding universal stress UspA family protein
MLPIQVILHPTDFSACSGNALQLAGALARDYGAQLVVLHVAQPPKADSGKTMPLPDPNQMTNVAMDRLNQMDIPDAGIGVERRYAEGKLVATIIRVAKEIHADLIVMGTRGRSGLERLLMGSVAEKAMRRAPCPVVTVRTPFLEAVADPPLATAAISDMGMLPISTEANASAADIHA